MSTSLLQQASSGDRDAMFELLLDHQRQLGRFVSTRLSRMPPLGVTADDIIQATFLNAFRSAKTLKAQSLGEYYSWLKTIAGNLINYEIRKAQTAKRGGRQKSLPEQDRHQRREFEDRAIEMVAELSADGNTPSQFAARHEVIQAMQIAISALPNDQQQAIQLRCFERMSLEQTATTMNRSTAAVHGLIHRAKKSLREMMLCSSRWFSKKQ